MLIYNDAKAGEKIPFEVSVTGGATLAAATWSASAGAQIVDGSQMDLPTSSAVLVSLPSAGTYKLLVTVDLSNGARLIGRLTVNVTNP